MTTSLPSDWTVEPLHAVAERVTVGIASAATHAYRQSGVPMLRNQNIKAGRLDDSDVLYLDPSYERTFRNKRLQAGDLITVRTGYPGVTCVVPPSYEASQSFTTLITRPKPSLVDSEYLCHFINSDFGQGFVQRSQIGGAQQNINARTFRLMPVWLPPIAEQRAIAHLLNDLLKLEAAIESRIVKQSAVADGLMQQLLTGTLRLPGFTGEWRRVKLASLLTPRVERNTGALDLEVLSCTKHRGFVRSLEYFRNQVFSKSLTGYRMIRRGDIGYPANHVEEGSIGVQDLYEVALVSPIYVVLKPNAGINSYFLHRQLKLESFRQQFARITNASVDRRGSLRWQQFSELEVMVPDKHEQDAISEVLRDSDAVREVLQRKLTKACWLRRAVTQELLRGRAEALA